MDDAQVINDEPHLNNAEPPLKAGEYNVNLNEVAKFTEQLQRACGGDPVKAYFMSTAICGLSAASIAVEGITYIKNAIQSHEMGTQIVAQSKAAMEEAAAQDVFN